MTPKPKFSISDVMLKNVYYSEMKKKGSELRL